MLATVHKHSLPLIPSSSFQNLFITSVSRINVSSISSPSLPKSFKCNSTINGSDSVDRETKSDSLKDAVSGMVDLQVKELLNREDNKSLLDGLEMASLRVEIAKKELAEIEKQELEAKLLRNHINRLEIRASEVAECQREISEARAMINEAERSLMQNTNDNVDNSNEINKDRERIESVKAALVSALVGTIAGLPVSFTMVSNSSQLLLPLAINFASCALFGATFRYAVRRDLDDIHLKSGTVAAFSIVKGLGTLGNGPPLELSAESFVQHAYDGAMFSLENLLIFVFAAVALDLCFKTRLVSPFPLNSDS